MHKSINQPVVIIPNLNGGEALLEAVESLVAQTVRPHIIVVDNASTDGSVAKLQEKYPQVELIKNVKNEGYTGGVNPGFQRAIELGADYAAPFNDDAIADARWLEHLVATLDSQPETGAAGPKVLSGDKQHLDSTGDYFTDWGLPYPRGRGEADNNQYDQQTAVFAVSGAASLYRVKALEQVGLLDQDFFAYYEDVDLGFRLQLAGWRAVYVPAARVYHQQGMTSGRMKGFTTYQTMKNLPMLTFKNVPRRYLFRVVWRLKLALFLFFLRAIGRGHGRSALRGALAACFLTFKKWPERRRIQKTRRVSDEYIWGLVNHDLPPNARALRKVRKLVTGRQP